MVRIIGIVLIVGGVIGLVYGGITYGSHRDTVQVGPLSASVTQRDTFPVSPVVAGLALIAGIALLVVGSRRKI
ncbi:MAG: DUF3185 domain-containing protein [Gemmatimonadota bacterium]